MRTKFYSAIAILFLFVPQILNAETIVLVDKSCVLSGPDTDRTVIKTTEGEKGNAICASTTKKSEYKCTYYKSNTGKELSSSNFEYLKMNKDIALMSNSDGNIKMIINYKNKTFSYGQANMILDSGLVITKMCAGILIDKDDVAKLLKEK